MMATLITSEEMPAARKIVLIVFSRRWRPLLPLRSMAVLAIATPAPDPSPDLCRSASRGDRR